MIPWEENNHYDAHKRMKSATKLLFGEFRIGKGALALAGICGNILRTIGIHSVMHNEEKRQDE